jgi:hypothetical protein
MHDEDRIRQRAYELWEQEGKPEGVRASIGNRRVGRSKRKAEAR